MQETRLLAQHGPSKVDRILAGPVSQLVHEAFDCEDIRIWPYAAPEAGDDTRRFCSHRLYAHIGDIVWFIGGAIDFVDVDAVSKRQRRWKPPSHD